MFVYRVNCRVCSTDQQEEINSSLRVAPQTGDDAVDNGPGGQTSTTPPEIQLTKYPLFWIPKVKKVAQEYKKNTSIKLENKQIKISPDIENIQVTDTTDSTPLQINVQLDFGKWFTWLERGIWITMIGSIIWALVLDNTKATKEVCLKNGQTHYPLNFLPSLSRTMGSFRIGTLFWTICMATAFIGRLLSNYFLHKLYEIWYSDNLFNLIYLRVAYYLDNIEIISLVMIPAYSLDCDWIAHRISFITFLVFTYIAQLLQYFTRFLKRKERLILNIPDINNYYKQIGLLIIFQSFSLLLMFSGFLLHEYICGDFYFIIFALGEYLTIIVNVRFKRDTILFVR